MVNSEILPPRVAAIEPAAISPQLAIRVKFHAKSFHNDVALVALQLM